MIPFLKKKIFLTRSDKDNLKFQKYFNLVQKKVDARELFVSTPLLNILFIKFEKLIIPEMNIIFTSRYAVKALTGIENLKLKQVYCVGKSTAETAIKYGYQKVQFSRILTRKKSCLECNSRQNPFKFFWKKQIKVSA